MRAGRLVGFAAAVASAMAAVVHPLGAQASATVDLGITDVRYDGFLPSAAASVSPELRLDGRRTFLSARGTYLKFESGNRSLQANVAGSVFSAAFGHWRAEFSGHAGVSRYADFANFAHVMAGPRIHVAGTGTGAWLGGSTGESWFGAERRPVASLAGGAWTRRLDAIWYLSLTTTWVGDTAFTDLVGATHATRGLLSLDGSLGVRAWSRGGGHGVFGEASAAWQVGSWLAVVLSGGRYPTDPPRGSVSGRYLGLAMRVTALPHRSAPRGAQTVHLSSSPAADPAPVSASAETRECACGGRTLWVHTTTATLVEVTGDFTDWEPMTLELDHPSTWTLSDPLPPGTYRFAVRIDGGDWFVPAGVTRVHDEFGGWIGLLMVP